MTRPYKAVHVVPQGNLFAVMLDHRAAATPQRAPIVLPTRALAEAIAKEWDQPGDKPDPRLMPLTPLACLAIDIAPTKSDALRAELMEFARTDQLCFTAPEHRAEHDRIAGPVLAWAEASFGGKLPVTESLQPITLTPELLGALAGAITRLDPWRLVAVRVAAGVARSLLVALALQTGRVDAEGAFQLATLEERLQAERWGEDPVQQARLADWQRELQAVERWLALLSA